MPTVINGPRVQSSVAQIWPRERAGGSELDPVGMKRLME
jgi:hypothetical protein